LFFVGPAMSAAPSRADSDAASNDRHVGGVRADKIEELVARSNGRIRADVVHAG